MISSCLFPGCELDFVYDQFLCDGLVCHRSNRYGYVGRFKMLTNLKRTWSIQNITIQEQPETSGRTPGWSRRRRLCSPGSLKHREPTITTPQMYWRRQRLGLWGMTFNGVVAYCCLPLCAARRGSWELCSRWDPPTGAAPRGPLSKGLVGVGLSWTGRCLQRPSVCPLQRPFSRTCLGSGGTWGCFWCRMQYLSIGITLIVRYLPGCGRITLVSGVSLWIFPIVLKTKTKGCWFQVLSGLMVQCYKAW